MTSLPAKREPLFKIPLVVVAVIAICAIVHVARGLLGRDLDFDLVARFAFVPARLTAWLAPGFTADHLVNWMQSGDPGQIAKVEALRFFLSQPLPPFLTLVSYAVFHGDWTHLGFNSLWLLAFGTPVARRFGPWRFLGFMLVAAFAGALAHWAIFPLGVEPVIGASASVSGCMGAALRFMFDPGESGRDGGGAEWRPIAPLRAMLGNRRALSFLIVWFGSNALFGIGSVGFGLTEAPVAWQAHVGGFLVGLLLFGLFDRRMVGPAPATGAPANDDPN